MVTTIRDIRTSNAGAGREWTKPESAVDRREIERVRTEARGSGATHTVCRRPMPDGRHEPPHLGHRTTGRTKVLRYPNAVNGPSRNEKAAGFAPGGLLESRD